MEEDIEKLNIFLLANIPEIITKEEFVEVKQAIENLIKRNKGLEEERQYEKELRLKYERRYDLAIENRQKNFIRKSKVREKIEEYENKLKQPTIQNINTSAYSYYLGKKEGWEELLEERN